MTVSRQQYLLNWLRDAHAMEQQAEELFSAHAKRFHAYQVISRLCEQEAHRSRNHQATISIRLQQLASDVSLVKNLAGKLMGVGLNNVGLAPRDTPVKAILQIHSFNQRGIGAYRVLLTATDALGDRETQRICQGILEQYKRRNWWLDKYLQQVTEYFITEAVA